MLSFIRLALVVMSVHNSKTLTKTLPLKNNYQTPEEQNKEREPGHGYTRLVCVVKHKPQIRDPDPFSVGEKCSES